jgi:hypothetical protein
LRKNLIHCWPLKKRVGPGYVIQWYQYESADPDLYNKTFLIGTLIVSSAADLDPEKRPTKKQSRRAGAEKFESFLCNFNFSMLEIKKHVWTGNSQKD